MALNPGTNYRAYDGRRAKAANNPRRVASMEYLEPPIHVYERTWFGKAFREMVDRKHQPSPIVAALRAIDFRRVHIPDTGIWAK